ncbi:MAG: hypothetical protein UR66_C0004G0033 [Candidatus Moranbacteria bacterium GW2011_GWE1_35_17]|nr:MAG: hypothetical protein UR66_C0004G0033 [Candidatus Moranbacteria bacterium GW2011_GWE1_35_17]KKP73840.1 MAG: hypothetical protein UR65_C0002G0004 [Candidatus Moranbacteria bacterium GW2011_GWE2_35_164]KKP80636.1 MAG: hypothetical protein UR82_C0087G0003 [Candidatus Moranbacteria bacterium GW2011_GWF1_35_5]KKP85122.1 MAG: hypothetical protein UR83_C0004G0010 [Candidatus Moranbacteria bacterium GW2011_GWF2_35_54]
MKNESGLDRIIRVVLAVIFFILGAYIFTGVLSVVAYVLAVVMLFTAMTGFCLGYKLFGINTDNK